MTKRSSLRTGLAMLALSWTAAGCADHVKSAVVTCPCERGICCASGVCADDESACEAATQALSSASVGHWTGYLENYKFPSGSDAVDLTLRVEADGSLAGEVVLGQGPAPAPPTDGTVGWPTGWYPPSRNDWYANPLEGFGHHLLNVQWTALRLKFDLNVREAWGAWCRLQPSYDTSRFHVPESGAEHVPAWGCSPDGGGGQCSANFSDDPDAAPVPVDCGWATLCQVGPYGACDCTAEGCDAKVEPYVSFDVALRDDEGDGSVGSPYFMSQINGRNIRLIRASH